MARYSTVQLITPPSFVNKLLYTQTTTFTVPEGVTALRVAVQGSGGVGCTSSPGNSLTAGGGGGFAQKVFLTRPGTSYCVVSASSAATFSCFPGVCATGGGTGSIGCGFGGEINTCGGAAGTQSGQCCDKTGCFRVGGAGGGGAGKSGNGTAGQSWSGTPSCLTGGCCGGAGSAGAPGGCPCRIDGQAPSCTLEIGLEGGGGGGSGSPGGNRYGGAGGAGGGGGGAGGQCNSNHGAGGTGGRGYVTVEF